MATILHTVKDTAQLKAKDIMKSPVITVYMWDSIHDVAKIFLDNNISGAPVVTMEEVPIGVITKTDLTRYDREQAGLSIGEVDKKMPKGFHLEAEEATIESWLTPYVFDVHPDTALSEVTNKMIKIGLHHIFVTDLKTKHVVGVITSFDIVEMLNRILNPK